MDRDQTILDQYFGRSYNYNDLNPSHQVSNDSDDSHSDTDEEYLSTIGYLNDNEWKELKYPSDGDGKFSWNPKPLESELLENRFGLKLAHAIYEKNIDQINELLKSRVNLEICDENGNNPLLLSIGYQFSALTKFLMQRGIELEDTNDEGANAFHIACLMGDEKLVHTLLFNSCNPNTIVRTTKDTPLHIACGAGTIHIIKMLVHKNVNLTARNINKDTPLDILKARFEEADIDDKEEIDACIKYLEQKIEKQRNSQRKKQDRFRHKIHNVGGKGNNERWYYNPDTSTLEPYPDEYANSQSKAIIPREPSKSVILAGKSDGEFESDDYDRFGWCGEDIESDLDGCEDSDVEWYENNDDPDFHDKYNLYEDESDEQEAYDYFWGEAPCNPENEEENENEDIVSLGNYNHNQNFKFDLDNDPSIFNGGRVGDGMGGGGNRNDSNTNINETGEKELFFCKKCFQEKLDITTGVCGNCQHIYGIYSECPWCNDGRIDGFGNCKECDFVLYKKSKKESYISFNELSISSDEEELECVLCGHTNEKLKFIEYCVLCGYFLSNLCNKCNTTLRFEGEDDEPQEACWQCGQSLIKSK